MRLISIGAATVDPRRSDPWSLAQLGIHPSWERIHDQKAAQATYKPGVDDVTGEPITVIAISGGDHWELKYTVGIGFGWGGQQSPSGSGRNGVKIVTKVPVIANVCGGAYWGVAFDGLSKDDTGWIIQHITITDLWVVGKNGAPVKSKQGSATQNFFEAWQVKDGKVLAGDTGKPVKAGIADYFGTVSEGIGTQGYFAIVGKVKFFPGYNLTKPPWGNTVKEAGSPNFRPTKKRPQPPGWSEDGASDHILTIEWNCIQGESRTIARTIPY